MKKPLLRASSLASPKQQHNWDWRAASNFIAGGAGGGLLLWASVVNASADATRMAILLGLILIGSGLTCVWFEIGRPWRALNVYRHFATSWMTREAVVALGVFAAGGLALLTGAFALSFLAGILGLTFLYSQARILAANKGIPAWRHPRSISLMIATGLAEGAGFLVCVLSLSSAAVGFPVLAGLIALIVVRALFWKSYLGALVADGAPDATLKVLSGIAPRLLVVGHILPALAVVAAMAGMPGGAVLSFAAGILVVAGGWFLKFTLVRRAAFTQGLALLHLPVRGQGTAGAATKPGWKTVPGVKAG
ncbi:MAG: anaerobic dimethyl sulfoxide reductase subunit C (DMSO reductase anchor subunit) [Rhodocyclaceae bacterium]|nr:MAG: anaerobic dimethyl sulfoxide reductase subunit C (DMSO reductase anchor subunit) [Rhodocyclaceae bacterium]TND03708.1 MAG: anaerobic dimethyl sulfoxide reductase subunit C (DMSO reductase anchor subunit) [Rhodocyclaceae bacterium]